MGCIPTIKTWTFVQFRVRDVHMVKIKETWWLWKQTCGCSKMLNPLTICTYKVAEAVYHQAVTRMMLPGGFKFMVYQFGDGALQHFEWLMTITVCRPSSCATGNVHAPILGLHKLWAGFDCISCNFGFVENGQSKVRHKIRCDQLRNPSAWQPASPSTGMGGLPGAQTSLYSFSSLVNLWHSNLFLSIKCRDSDKMYQNVTGVT